MIQQFRLWVYTSWTLIARTQLGTRTPRPRQRHRHRQRVEAAPCPSTEDGRTRRGPSSRGMLFSLKQEAHPDACSNKDEA